MLDWIWMNVPPVATNLFYIRPMAGGLMEKRDRTASGCDLAAVSPKQWIRAYLRRPGESMVTFMSLRQC
jgi:hypothetical protein